ncbi:MAG: DUF4185 domain-containing protein [Planctomycetota bacterium]
MLSAWLAARSRACIPRSTRPLAFLIGMLGCESSPTLPPGILVLEAHAAADLDARFQRTEGWTGGDGVYSVQLSDDRVAWLFSDSWVGRIAGGRRIDATIVNNAVAVQSGLGSDALVQFVVPQTASADGKVQPRAFVQPEPASGRWYWLQAGVRTPRGLQAFAAEIERTAAGTVFGFRAVGSALVTVEHPDAPLAVWQPRACQVPFADHTPDREIAFGAAILEHHGWLYVYGIDEDRHRLGGKRLVVARVPPAALDQWSSWEFFEGSGRWGRDFRRAAPVCDGMANELSVTWHEAAGVYLAVCTENGMSPRIVARAARSPTGPWSKAVVLYECPEAGWDQRIFCYAAKAHAVLSHADTLVVSYVANSLDFWQVAADARLYWPRFVRVRWTALPPGARTPDREEHERAPP